MPETNADRGYPELGTARRLGEGVHNSCGEDRRLIAPPEADAGVLLKRLQFRLEAKEPQLATARANCATLPCRKAVGSELRLADFIRHPLRSGTW